MTEFDTFTLYSTAPSKIWLDDLSADIHGTAIEKGFWEDGINDNVIGTKLALIHSEVTEVLEAVRKNKGSLEIVEEMADVLIRLLDLYEAMYKASIVLESLDEVVRYKVAKNKTRPQKHGNRF